MRTRSRQNDECCKAERQASIKGEGTVEGEGCRRSWEMLLLGQDARLNFSLYSYGETDSFPKEGTEQPAPALALASGSAAPSLGVDGSQWLEPPLD